MKKTTSGCCKSPSISQIYFLEPLGAVRVSQTLKIMEKHAWIDVKEIVRYYALHLAPNLCNNCSRKIKWTLNLNIFYERHRCQTVQFPLKRIYNNMENYNRIHKILNQFDRSLFWLMTSMLGFTTWFVIWNWY